MPDTPHRATPEQWALVNQYTEIDCYSDSCLLELRDRLQAAEQRISELEGNANLRQQDEDAERAAEPSAPTGSLVEVVADTLHVEAGFRDSSPDGPWTVEARAAILAVADWLSNCPDLATSGPFVANRIRAELECHG